MTIRSVSPSIFLHGLLAAIIIIFGGCDGTSDDSSQTVTGTLTATIGGVAYTATSFSRLTANGLTITTTSGDGRSLSLTFLGISSDGQYSLINRALDPTPGVAGGYSADGETYNIDTGIINLTAYTNDGITGTFVGTATGLLGAPDLAVLGGSIDVEF